LRSVKGLKDLNSTDKNKEELYFIAIIPPAPLRDEIMALKEHFRDNYNSKASLNSPPHITLHMPFRLKAKKEDYLIKALQDLASVQKSFTIQLKDYGAFPPRVIYIDVERNQALVEVQKELNKTCRQKLNLHNANYKDQGFHPHITLAFRDLRKAKFMEAWQDFKTMSFEAQFEVDKLSLLKHNGKHWEVFREFEWAGTS
jgi:2'-5' RNA ligase